MTKVKKTKMDYEVVKRFNESLQYENKRLHNELHELRNLKVDFSLTRVCPSYKTAPIAKNTGAFTLTEVNYI